MDLSFGTSLPIKFWCSHQSTSIYTKHKYLFVFIVELNSFKVDAVIGFALFWQPQSPCSCQLRMEDCSAIMPGNCWRGSWPWAAQGWLISRMKRGAAGSLRGCCFGGLHLVSGGGDSLSQPAEGLLSAVCDVTPLVSAPWNLPCPVEHEVIISGTKCTSCTTCPVTLRRNTWQR